MLLHRTDNGSLRALFAAFRGLRNLAMVDSTKRVFFREVLIVTAFLYDRLKDWKVKE